MSMNETRPQLQAEVKMLSSEDKQELIFLWSVGITIDIRPDQELVLKADLVIPWNKLRTIRG